MTFETGECCAVAEFDGLTNDPEDALAEICDEWFTLDNFNGTFIIFTDIGDFSKGKALKKYIKANRLGTVTSPVAKKNPNSLNAVKVFLWRVNITKLEQLASKKGWI